MVTGGLASCVGELYDRFCMAGPDRGVARLCPSVMFQDPGHQTLSTMVNRGGVENGIQIITPPN